MLVGLALALGLIGVLRLAIGTTFFGFPGADQPAVWSSRCMRMSIGLVVGVALAGSGVSLQALLRNPLAEPFLLGLSSGAALGVMTNLYVSFTLGLTLATTPVAALLGALATMAVVYLAGRRRGVIDPLGLLLVGVVLSTINGAVIMLLNYLAAGKPAALRDDLARWMMGYLNENLERQTVWIVAAVTGVALLALLKHGRAMDVATFSESEALSMGVNLPRLRSFLFLVASVLAAGTVILAGPIAFVGLVCPHLGRLLVGPRHGPLLLAAAMLGGMLLILADAAGASMNVFFGVGQVPVGVFTAMVGGPVFLWMLRPHLGKGE